MEKVFGISKWIDLHLHLDGSLSAETVLQLAQKAQVVLPTENAAELRHYITADRNCSDLNDYLKCFDITLAVLQTAENLQTAVIRLMHDLKRSGVVYAEIRYAPQLHLRNGLNQKQVIAATLSGLAQGTKETGVKANLILCCMRGNDNQAANLETVKLAAEFLGRGVVAVDLAGAEALFPTSQFADVFALAVELEIPFTIHAGEAAGADSIRQALLFGAQRIGHGVRAEEDAEITELLLQRGIPLEMCPISNQQTKAVQNIDDYPLRRYLQQGMTVTVNTDNMVVSGTTIPTEFAFLRDNLALTAEEAQQLLKNSVTAAFLTADEKAELLKKLDSDVN